MAIEGLKQQNSMAGLRNGSKGLVADSSHDVTSDGGQEGAKTPPNTRCVAANAASLAAPCSFSLLSWSTWSRALHTVLKTWACFSRFVISIFSPEQVVNKWDLASGQHRYHSKGHH